MVDIYMERQSWRSNCPKPSDVLKAWKPPQSRRKHGRFPNFEAKVASQDWDGLVAVEDQAKGGFTLKTARVFKKGDLVCDYHGVLMDGKEGEEVQRSITDGKCYIYFFRHQEKRMCVNATKAPCDCHPDMSSTFGRLINHSRKRANLKPLVKCTPEGRVPVILFEAMKDLSPGTELFFDYGVRRRTYGEAAHLDWLDT
ncbi:histone-lysine N-methyltransferase set-1-like [Bufo gargarizans]|uniref:histone-lysine N-methyltransferase set-1-like n=1 Tax=Bufo gargarizans TaxID=30331 RepID=UPI001CF15DC2|nr:histone-lysine N-methyltransferase set-1-like [Bufo gargarizans]XP_044129687.1 histone-lysine N-methyltransferase set-1-like [Bufo gargarizans]